jgi:pseudouridine-5'-phosphate glycosidase
VLVVQPPPADVALDAEQVERAVQRALQNAQKAGVRGAEVTPYLLAEVSRETRGGTLAANLGLLEANARLAAEIAVALGSG